jgi:hypothetical protein
LRKIKRMFSLLFLTGCAGTTRSCSNWSAETFGGDWIIVQYNYSGTPFNCWKLNDTSVTNESNSDGIYWTTQFGHNIHVGGWYNRVQVSNGDFTTAAKELGVDLNKCTTGHYPNS